MMGSLAKADGKTNRGEHNQWLRDSTGSFFTGEDAAWAFHGIGTKPMCVEDNSMLQSSDEEMVVLIDESKKRQLMGDDASSPSLLHAREASSITVGFHANISQMVGPSFQTCRN